MEAWDPVDVAGLAYPTSLQRLAVGSVRVLQCLSCDALGIYMNLYHFISWSSAVQHSKSLMWHNHLEAKQISNTVYLYVFQTPRWSHAASYSGLLNVAARTFAGSTLSSRFTCSHAETQPRNQGSCSLAAIGNSPSPQLQSCNPSRISRQPAELKPVRRDPSFRLIADFGTVQHGLCWNPGCCRVAVVIHKITYLKDILNNGEQMWTTYSGHDLYTVHRNQAWKKIENDTKHHKS